jgi:hypothetical protein
VVNLVDRLCHEPAGASTARGAARVLRVPLHHARGAARDRALVEAHAAGYDSTGLLRPNAIAASASADSAPPGPPGRSHVGGPLLLGNDHRRAVAIDAHRALGEAAAVPI